MRERRLVFGEVAELYDSVRPSYPDALVDDVLAFADAGPGDPALEVGAGTGKATELFAARGLDLTCVEPSAEMAAVLRGIPNIVIDQTGFEEFLAAPHSFKLLYSAQAWHWVDPAVRYPKAHELLRADGAPALFFNNDAVAAGPLLRPARRGLRALWQRGERTDRADREAPRPGPDPPRRDQSLRGLPDATVRDYPWTCVLSAERYIQLLSTYSNHLLVEEGLRNRLLSAVKDTIDAAGGEITLDRAAELYLARPRPR